MDHAWEDYLYWQQTDKSTLRKINGLIKEILRTPLEGTGKSESLKENLSGFWSRRINLEHRLVYKADNDAVIIIQCRYHTTIKNRGSYCPVPDSYRSLSYGYSCHSFQNTLINRQLLFRHNL